MADEQKKGRGVPVVARYNGKGKGYDAWYRRTKYHAASVDKLIKAMPDTVNAEWVRAACRKARSRGKAAE